jgi:hydroxymethylpyrimidine kinase/phosphomethylpyrimidine kinase
MGPAAVLVKGGHLEGAGAVDVLVTPEGVERFEGERIVSTHTHGTGCTYSAAIATGLGRGMPLRAAVGAAKEFITGAIRHGLAVGKGTGPTDPFFFLRGGRDGKAWLRRIEGKD